MQLNTIKCWAEEDRPREKLLLKGRRSLSSAELLALIISTGSKELTAVELSMQILQSQDNSISNLSRASIYDLMLHKGVGEAKAISIIAAMELSRRKESESIRKKIVIKKSEDAYICLKRFLADLNHEEFYTLLLNRANEVIQVEQVSKGGVSGTVADGKIIFKRALEVNASSIILAHNHPSGQLKPSEQDISLTKSLLEFGKFIDLQITDHLIITDNNYFSFVDEGIL